MSHRILPVDRTSFSAAIGVAIGSCHFLDVCQHIWGWRWVPTKVTRLALQNAASIAGLVFTTVCIVVTPSSAERAHATVPEGMCAVN